jgi:hypothetical protein
MSNTDLQQYNSTGGGVFPTTGQVNTNADQYLIPTDGPLVTADSNNPNQAPINVVTKTIRDWLVGLRGAIVGDFTGAVRKTLKSLEVDGAGANTSTLVPGTARFSGGTLSGTTAPTTSAAQGTVAQDSVCLGWARGYWNGAAMVLVRGWNVRSLTRNAQGDYTVVFNSTVGSPGTAYAQVTMGINPSVISHGFVGNILQIADDGSSRISVEFITIDPNANLQLDTTATSQFFVEVRGY